jgi:DHA3 family macrolide efflux protein-like MFS transporter
MLLAVGAAAVVGVMNPLTMGPFFAVIQATVEPGMQARILTLMSSVGAAIAPVGLIIAGPIADRVGIQSWFFLGGALCVLMGISGLFIPAVMNIEERGSVGTQLSDCSV